MIKKLLITMFFLFAISFGQNYEDCVSPLWYFQNFGSANNALANNTTAYSSGLSALFANPAALGKETNVIFGFSVKNNNFSQNSKFFSTADLINSHYIDDNLITSKFDGFGAVLPIPVYRGSLVFGLSYSQVAIYNDQTNAEGKFTYDGVPFKAENYYEETGVMNNFRMGFALEYKKNLYLGSSVNFYSGKKTQEYNYTDFDETDQFFYNKITKNYEISPEYGGLNFNIGVLYDNNNWIFGANFSTPFSIETKEKYNDEEVWIYDNGERESDIIADRIKYDIKTPSSLSLGLGYRIGSITLLADVKTMDWHSMEFDSKLYDYTFNDDGEILTQISTDKRINKEIRSNLTKTIDYGFALSTEIFDEYTFNIGHRIIALPYFDMPKSDEKIHLTGIGMETTLFELLQIGLSYQFEVGKNEINKEFFEYPVYRKYNSQNITLTTSLIF